MIVEKPWGSVVTYALNQPSYHGGRVYVAGSPTAVGTCVPFMEQWIPNCAGANRDTS